jgi:hypothetical protein
MSKISSRFLRGNYVDTYALEWKVPTNSVSISTKMLSLLMEALEERVDLTDGEREFFLNRERRSHPGLGI